jgi:hypothetical protein
MIVRRARRALRLPPEVVAARIGDEARVRLDRVLAPRTAHRLTAAKLARSLDAASVDELWESLAARPFAADTRRRSDGSAHERVRARAADALARRVDLLGSGPTKLGTPIDWHTDFKSGRTWPLAYGRSIAYSELGAASDVKVPWELSRMQWLIPVGQLYLLDGDDAHAAFVRTIVEEWLDANPYALGVNWSVTMDVALRLITWTWFFHVFSRAASWCDEGFRARLLTSLYLHGRYVERNLERSDVNGNHFTADAAGLVFAGAFFGRGAGPTRWLERGWQILRSELPRQVYGDGVDFEASVPYHRLVAELFLLPALYRQRLGLDVDDAYRARLLRMADFADAYNRPDHGAPVWGDADDARVLPLGPQPVNDHSYLPGLIRSALRGEPAGSDEAYWLLGERGGEGCRPRRSTAFSDGGFYVLQGERDHVFVDCGPVGLAGRGGHGHNDCLAFEAVLDGVRLIVDCGAYVYTSSVEWRNRFRSTAFHNTPRVDGAEQNRFVDTEDLWNLHYDAVPQVLEWEPGAVTRFTGTHAGYRRLSDPVAVTRTLLLDTNLHRLALRDAFEARSRHEYRVPFHLAADIELEVGERRATLRRGRAEFVLAWSGAWEPEIRETWVSPSYGVKHLSHCLELVGLGSTTELVVGLGAGVDDTWAAGAIAR